MPKSTTNKVKARIPEILAGIKEGKTIGEIAREQNVTRRTINFNMVTPEFQALLKENVGEILNVHFERNEVLWNSDDPDDRRESHREMGRMARVLIPKVSLEQSESYNVDVRAIELQRIIESLPYEERRKMLQRFESEEEVPRIVESEIMGKE